MEKNYKKIENGRLMLEINKEIYAKEAILATSYKFTNRVYVHIEPISESVIGVYLQLKKEINSSLEDIANEFYNELIDQQVRINTESQYKHIRDAIVRQAFSPIAQDK